MADTKISNLTPLTIAEDADLFAIVDMSALPIETKKISFLNLRTSLNLPFTGQIDGGTPSSIYGGTFPINGGIP